MCLWRVPSWLTPLPGSLPGIGPYLLVNILDGFSGLFHLNLGSKNKTKIPKPWLKGSQLKECLPRAEIYKIVALKSLVPPTVKIRKETTTKAPWSTEHKRTCWCHFSGLSQKNVISSLGVSAFLTPIVDDFDISGLGNFEKPLVRRQYDKWFKCGIWSQTIEVQISALPLPGCVTLEKLLNSPVFSFLIFKIG